MTDLDNGRRVKRVREALLHTTPGVCSERALLITDSYKATEDEPIIIRRAKAFDKILSEMTIFIEPEQMIVGNQASELWAAPIFPEYSFEWVLDELDDFEKRPGDAFKIKEETKNELLSIQEYWKGKTHLDQVSSNLTQTNILAEKQNVIHRGGISMSGDGHIIPNHEKILSVGLSGIIQEAEEKLKAADLDTKKRDFYRAVVISLNAALKFAQRFADKAYEMSLLESDGQRKAELLDISKTCGRVFKGAPKTYLEALQAVYFTHLLMMIESNGHSFSFGRFDQYMYPFFDADMHKGLTKEKALEYTALFFVKLNTLNKIRPWDHTKFSAGYPLYSNLMVGGMKADGTDGTNELSYLCLDAMDLSRMPEPNLSVRYWHGSPKKLLFESAKLIREGFGMPSMFCDETAIAALKSINIPEEVARDYASMGCVEIAIPGRWGHRATGMTYMNFGKIVELMLGNGFDPHTGIRLISVDKTDNSISRFADYDELWRTWERFLKFYTDLAVESDYVCDRSLKHHDSDPFASALVDKCIERGKTLKEGGAEFDFVSQSTIGTAVVSNSLAAIKKLVFDEKVITFEQLKSAIDDNWGGEEGAAIRRLAQNAPKFGNDDDYADSIAADVYLSYLKLLPDYKNERFGNGPFGCGYTMSTSNISSYVPYGMDVGATPDGRAAGEPLNEGASPTIGTDKQGPTAVLKSISKLPNCKMAGGQLLNIKLSPGMLSGDDNLVKFVALLNANRLLGNFHVQFNVIDSGVLKEAQKSPEKYPDIMVRVAGYCALFASLTPNVQDAIIGRTEHNAM